MKKLAIALGVISALNAVVCVVSAYAAAWASGSAIDHWIGTLIVSLGVAVVSGMGAASASDL